MKAVFGSMEFAYLCIGRDTNSVVIIHSVESVVEVTSEEEADRLLDETGDSYLIPELSKKEILFSNPEAAIKFKELQ
jgi:energy-converting hydrogenase A subunit M